MGMGCPFARSVLKVEKALLELGKRGEIIGSEYLPLGDGEINLDLIEPAGMNWRVHEDGIGPTGSNAFDRPLAAMSRAVVHDPEDAVGRLIGFLTHDLSHETVGGRDTAFLLTATEEFGAMDVPSCQIGPRAFTKILVFYPHRAADSGRYRGLLAGSRLNAGFFVSGDHEVIGLEGRSLPQAGIKDRECAPLSQRNPDRGERSNYGAVRGGGHRRSASARG
jgi:hypothetical protein